MVSSSMCKAMYTGHQHASIAAAAAARCAALPKRTNESGGSAIAVARSNTTAVSPKMRARLPPFNKERELESFIRVTT